MGNELIDQHKLLAMGKDVDVGGEDIERAFGKGRNLHGKEEVSKKKHLHDEKRSLRPVTRVADHGEHGMNEPRDGKYDQF